MFISHFIAFEILFRIILVYSRPFLNCLSQEDERLADKIKSEYIRSPNNKSLVIGNTEVNDHTKYEINRMEQSIDIVELGTYKTH